MRDEERYQLLGGPYQSPRVRIGAKLTCYVRDVECTVTGYTDAPLPWPVGKPKGGRAKGPIVTERLVKMIRIESNIALCRLLNVTPQTISKWRRALGVPVATPGTVRLGQLYMPERISSEAFQRGIRAAHTRAANRKRSATLTGVSRPDHVRAILDRTGKMDSEATRKKKSRAAKRRGAWPPAAGRPWTAEEDQAVMAMPPKLAAKATGRPLDSVWSRKRQLNKS